MGTFAGIGQLAPTEQLIMSLRLTQRFKVNQDLTNIVTLKTLFEEITGFSIPGKMPVIGNKIFQVESGIHIDGIMKNQSNYETFSPETVGQKREIVIGKHSGTNSIRYKAKEMQLSYQEENLIDMLQVIKTTSITLRRSLTDRELAKVENLMNPAFFEQKLYELEILKPEDSSEEKVFFSKLFHEM